MHGLGFDFQWQGRSMYVLFLDRAEHVSHESLKEAIYDEYRRELSVASVVVVREPVAHPLPADGYIPAEALATLLSRNVRLPLHIVGSRDYQPVISPNLNDAVTSPLLPEMNEEFLRQLRQKELEFFVQDAGALLRATGSLIFRAPSKKYCNSFLRVGSAQTHRVVLDSFFFWLLPWLKGSDAIVTDSWTISSIALNASRLLARYDPDQRPHCRVDMLSEYFDGSTQQLVSTANAVLRRVATPTKGRLLILISSCMSGNLSNRLHAIIDKEFLDATRFHYGTLYSLAKGHAVPALCDLSDGLADARFDWTAELAPKDSHKTVIDIDRKAYFPLEVHEAPILISKGINEEAKGATAFLNRYRNSGLLSVHRHCYDIYNQVERHHAVFTDLLAIADHPEFEQRFTAKLQALPHAPSLVITPPHHAGKRLAEKAVAHFAQQGVKVPLFLHADLDLLAANAGDDEQALRSNIQALGLKDSILIVDDVSVTGRRLNRFLESLRTLNYIGNIHIIVGIARPTSKEEWERRVQQLRFRENGDPHTIDCVEFVILPDWDHDDCPWCAEMRLYAEMTDEYGRLPDQLARRQQRLTKAQTTTGLVTDLFLNAVPTGPLAFNRNSIFLDSPATQADVFVGVAGSIQRLRTGDDTYRKGKPPRDYQPRLQPHYPQIALIGVENYLGDRFSEAVIRAAIIRASMESDLGFPTTQTENLRIQRAKQLVMDRRFRRQDLALELLLAAAHGKLPRLSFAAHEIDSLRENPSFDSIDFLRRATA